MGSAVMFLWAMVVILALAWALAQTGTVNLGVNFGLWVNLLLALAVLGALFNLVVVPFLGRSRTTRTSSTASGTAAPPAAPGAVAPPSAPLSNVVVPPTAPASNVVVPPTAPVGGAVPSPTAPVPGTVVPPCAPPGSVVVPPTTPASGAAEQEVVQETHDRTTL